MKTTAIIFVFLLSVVTGAHPGYAQVKAIEDPALEKAAGQSEQGEAESVYRKEIIANDLLEQAFRETNDTAKIQLFKKALGLNPQNPDAHNSLGVIYKKLKMYNLALESYKNALNIPDYRMPEHAHNNIGVLYKEMEDYDLAIEEFKKAVTIKPGFAKAWNNMGTAYKSKGMFDEAINCFKKALKLKPDYLQASENLKNVWKLPKGKSPERKRIESSYNNALQLYRAGKIKEAILGFEEVEQLDPDYGNVRADLELARNALSLFAHLRRADQKINRGLVDSARLELQQGAKFAEGYELKAKLAEKLEEIKQKSELIVKTNRSESLYQEGIVQLQQKKWLKAISLFTKIIIVDPGYRDVQMYNQRARVSFYLADAAEKTKQLQWEEAKVAYKTLLKIDPQNQEAQNALEGLSAKKDKSTIDFLLLQAEESLNFQDMETAERSFREVLAVDPENPVALQGLKKIIAMQQVLVPHPEKTFTNKRKLVKLGGIAAVALLILLILLRTLQPRKILEHYRKLKDFDKTRIVYERILDTEPHRRNIYSPLASLYYQLKLQRKLPALLDYCRHQIHEAGSRDAPLWQLTLGEIYLENKEFEKALVEIEKASEMAPGLEEITVKLIKTYEGLLQDDPKNSTWQERIRQIKEGELTGGKLSSVHRAQGQSIANMDDETKRALLKECFGRKKDPDPDLEKKDKKTTEPKLHPATS